MWFSKTASLPQDLQTKPRHSPKICKPNHVTPPRFANQTTSFPLDLQTKPRHSRKCCKPNHVTPKILHTKPRHSKNIAYQTTSLQTILHTKPCHSKQYCIPNHVTPPDFANQSISPPKNVKILLKDSMGEPPLFLKTWQACEIFVQDALGHYINICFPTLIEWVLAKFESFQHPLPVLPRSSHCLIS